MIREVSHVCQGQAPGRARTLAFSLHVFTFLISHISVTALQITPIVDSRYFCSIAFGMDHCVRCMGGARGQKLGQLFVVSICL